MSRPNHKIKQIFRQLHVEFKREAYAELARAMEAESDQEDDDDE